MLGSAGCWVLQGAQHHCLQLCSSPSALALRSHLCSSFHLRKPCLAINKSWAPGCCTAGTPAQLPPASVTPPGCLCWVRGSTCGREGVSPEQRGYPSFAPRTPITWCGWDGCPPGHARAGHRGQGRPDPAARCAPEEAEQHPCPLPGARSRIAPAASPGPRATREPRCSSAHAAGPAASLQTNWEAEGSRWGSGTAGPGEGGGPSKPPQAAAQGLGSLQTNVPRTTAKRGCPRWCPCCTRGGMGWAGRAGALEAQSRVAAPLGPSLYQMRVFFPIASPPVTAAPPDVPIPGAAPGPAVLEVFLDGGKPWDPPRLVPSSRWSRGGEAW